MPESRLGATTSLIGISTYLDTVLQTVQLENRCCQFTEDLSLNGVWIVTSQQELAIWQPAWPTVENNHVSASIEENISILTSRIDERC